MLRRDLSGLNRCDDFPADLVSLRGVRGVRLILLLGELGETSTAEGLESGRFWMKTSWYFWFSDSETVDLMLKIVVLNLCLMGVSVCSFQVALTLTICLLVECSRDSECFTFS